MGMEFWNESVCEVCILEHVYTFLCRSCLYTFRYVGKQSIAIKM